MPAMGLVNGGAQVEAAAHHAMRVLDRAIAIADAPDGDPTVAAMVSARDVLATGLGVPRRRQPKTWTDEEEGDHLANEARIERRAA